MPRRVLKRCLCVLAATVCFASASAATAAQTPEDTVRDTANSAQTILGDKSLTSEQKIERLGSLMDRSSDFETTAKLVLARGWRDLSAEQRLEFQRLLRDYLIARYRDRVDDYGGEKLLVTGGREEARGDYTVHAKVDRGGAGEPVLVDYRLRKGEDGRWRVIDVIAERISIVSNLRSQFQSILSRGGPEHLLETLREKIAKGEVEPADGPL